MPKFSIYTLKKEEMPLNFFYTFNAIVCISILSAQAFEPHSKRNWTCANRHKSSSIIKLLTICYKGYFSNFATVFVPSLKVVTATFTPSKGLLLSTPARL